MQPEQTKQIKCGENNINTKQSDQGFIHIALEERID